MRNILRLRNPVRKIRSKGDVARDARQWQLAAALYETYLSYDETSEDAPIWVQLGHARKESGDDDGAMRAYHRALEIEPGVADTHLQIGHLHKKMGQVDLALVSFAEALRIDETSAHEQQELYRLSPDGPASRSLGIDKAEYLLARADTCRDGQRWDEAAGHYAAYLKLRPDVKNEWPIYIQLGHARRESGDLQGAVEAYECAAGFAPDEPEPHFHLGNVLDEMGELKAAIASFAEAARLDPDHADFESRLRQSTLRAATLSTTSHCFDGDDSVHVAFPPPRGRAQVAFDPVFPPIYPGLSRRFNA